jgi:uncharacterized protein YkwD
VRSDTPNPARRPARVWIIAGSGAALVLVAVAALIGTAVLGAPASRTAADAAAGTGASTGTGPPAAGPSDDQATPTPSAASVVPSPTPTKAPVVKATTKPPAAAKSTTETAYEASVLTLVNQERAKAGCRALTADSRLAKAAKGHSADMATRGYFDHTTPDGVSFATRITNAGYRWSGAAENIAEGQKDPAAAMTAWMNSAGHRANILNCGYRNLGVGLAYNAKKTPYWTQDFGTPA